MTKNRSFFKTPNRLKISLAVFAAALLLSLASFLPRVQADNAPDWLRAAAQEKLPEYPKDAVAVVILDEQQTVVSANGQIETRTRRAYKILRPEATRQYGYGYARVTFDNETKISFFKAWTITPDGHELEVKEKDAVEEGLSSFEVFSDVRAKYLKFPEANPGSVVGYESVQKRRPQVFDDVWTFQETVPVRRSRYTLQLPPGWELTTLWANHPDQPPQSAGTNQYVWEVTDSPAIEIEPDMPASITVEGNMVLKFFPRDLAMRAKITGSWNDIGIWYYGLVAPRRVATPEIKQKVAELTAGITDPLEKIRALAAFSQRQIRYAAIEIGIGGYQPHAAADVLAHRYGDCKDKATLLNTMLQEIGIESYNVLISPQRGLIRPGFPLLMFGHSIVAIRLPDAIPTGNLYAVVNDPKLGRLLFFDPTSEYTPLGYLPPIEQTNYALVVTPQGGELILVPLLPASTNRLLRTAKLTLSSSGNLNGEVQELRWGGPAVESRAQFLTAAPADRQKILEKFLGNTLTNFSLTGASLGNLEKYDESLTVNYKFAVDGYAKTAGNLLILRPGVVGTRGSNLLSGKPRKYPIEFPEATRQDDVFDIALPAGYVVDELPKPVLAECAYGTYKSEVLVADNVLHYKRTYEIRDVTVPTQKLDEVRDFFHQIAADQKSSAVLRRANP
jgi:transglutaminase-like putative cysteine protease